LLTQQHQQLQDLLVRQQWDEAQTFWLELAEQHPKAPDQLLLLVQDFAAAGQAALAAELAELIAGSLKETGRLHEWLFALKLQAQAHPTDRALRAEIVAAYRQVYEADPRLKTILAAAAIEDNRTPLPDGCTRVDRLLALNVGAHCQHKSWGFGRVTAFDIALQRVVVSFPGKAEHLMQLAYAADSLPPVSADHLEVRKATDLAGLQKLAAEDPVALLRIVLLSHDRAATADQIERALVGSVLPADQWKRWWDHVRKLAKKDRHFELPAKKINPVRLRTAPVSQQDALLAAFQEALDITQRVAATRQLLKIVDEIEQPDLLLQEFADGLLDALKKTKPDRAVDRLDAAFVLEDLLAHQKTPTETATRLIDDLLAGVRDLPALLDGLSAASEKRAIAALKRGQPDRLLQQLNRLPARILDDLTDLLAANANRIIQHVRNQTAGYELLHWVARVVTAPAPPVWLESLPPHMVLAAILNALDLADTRGETKKLRDLLTANETLLPDLLAQASPDIIRDLSRQLLASGGFEELDRRSLMARVVKEYPFVQGLLITRTVKEQPLIVSRASFQQRQAELDDLIQKKIPANSKEIGHARSYGDLSENFEFKAAKHAQRLLMQRRAELELMLGRAQPTDFPDVNTDSVQIGTSVTVTDLATGQPQTYHILGAWDGDPARNIISYPAALAQSLLNKKPGDTIAAAGETGPVKLRIDRIEKAPAEVLAKL
jgi:transcription elongation GreA/GreB family factor